MLEEVGISAEVVDPRTTWPLDEKTLIESVKKTSRCIVLDEGYWKRAFAGDRGVLGRAMTVGGVTYTIVGIAPQGFTGVELERRDAWVPISLTYWGPGANWATGWDINWLQIVGRLKPGVSLEDVGSRATIAHRRAFDGPANHTMRTATLSAAPLRFNARAKAPGPANRSFIFASRTFASSISPLSAWGASRRVGNNRRKRGTGPWKDSLHSPSRSL